MLTIKPDSNFIAAFRRAFHDEHFDIIIVNDPRIYNIEVVNTFSQDSGSEKNFPKKLLVKGLINLYLLFMFCTSLFMFHSIWWEFPLFEFW